jgi:uncharacterized protein YecT (DUF1311 family)
MVNLESEAWLHRQEQVEDELRPGYNETLAAMARSMLAMMKMFSAREESRNFWFEAFVSSDTQIREMEGRWIVAQNQAHDNLQCAQRAEQHVQELDQLLNDAYTRNTQVVEQRDEARALVTEL